MSRRLLTFSHRSGVTIDLPLLVPAFSSKGFPFKRVRRGRREIVQSEASVYLDTLSPYLKEAILVSAYDVHHDHFASPDVAFGNASLVLLDSGGYELAADFDSSEPRITERLSLKFEIADYLKTLTRLGLKHRDRPIVIANFDWDSRNNPFSDQIRAARSLFNKFKHWSNDFVIKPHTQTGAVLDIDQLVPHVGDLRSFDIVGTTEKELGKNLMDRLRRICRLRVEMIRKSVSLPIHVWGGLDPVLTPLYFFAGADIFDGVSWLRYAFHNGLAINRESASVLAGGITTPHDHAIGLALNHNLTALQGLANALRAFAMADKPSFDMFDHNGAVYAKAFEVMTARIPEMAELY